jgi:hypothetical protein
MRFIGRRKGERRSIEIPSPGTDRRDHTDRRSGVPRRRHERYKAKNNVFVEIKDSVVKMGQVLDISKGGLAFHYLDFGRQPKKSFEIDILVKNNGFHLGNVQFKGITDLKADKEYALSYMPIRRLGGQFNKLSQNQMYQIENLIMHHTLDVV